MLEPQPPAKPLPPLPRPAADEPLRLPGAILGFSLAHFRRTNEATGVSVDTAIGRGVVTALIALGDS